MSLFRQWRLVAVAIAVAACGGCSDGRVKKALAPTEGTVMCEGQPVPFVAVFFEPVAKGKDALAGKQGIGYCDEKGHFVISTYDTNDGAVIGHHNVKVGPPMGEPRPGFKCNCVLNTEVVAQEVDVVDGDNKFEIKLNLATKRDKQIEAREAARNKED